MSNCLAISRPDLVPHRRHGAHRLHTQSDSKTRRAEHRPNIQNSILLLTRTKLQNIVRPGVDARQEPGCHAAGIQEVIGGIEIFLGCEGDGSVGSAGEWVALVGEACGKRRKVEGEGAGRWCELFSRGSRRG